MIAHVFRIVGLEKILSLRADVYEAVRMLQVHSTPV